MIGRNALIAHIWDRGVDTVEDLIEAVQRVQAGRERLSSVFTEAAWGNDWQETRGVLATLGTTLLRFFNGAWRSANRKARSHLVDPKLPVSALLAQLDDLIGTQAAQKRVAEGDRSGEEAFGTNWRRERSDVEFLRGVADWMRSLRPLGEGVRERLADITDRELAAELAGRVLPLAQSIRERLMPLSERLVAGEKRPWGEETVLRRVPLHVIVARCDRWRRLQDACAPLNTWEGLSASSATQAISRIVRTQDALSALEDASAQGQALFGLSWKGLASDRDALVAATGWMQAHGALRHLAAKTLEPQRVLDTGIALKRDSETIVADLGRLFATLQFSGNLLVALGPEASPLESLSVLLGTWEEHSEALPQWVSYQARAGEASDKGLRSLVERMAGGQVSANDAVGIFKLSYYEAILAVMVRREPLLSQFDGERQRLIVNQFGQLDEARMEFAKFQVQSTHRDRMPSRAGATGPTAQLLGEMAKKRGHLPIRQLMSKCGRTVQALKPVFMMSPLSVAQFLPPGEVEFDLLVVDEASQVQPVDALGAIARAKQLVIVGDERQLPPTRFFAKVVGETDSAENEEGAAAADVESVLGLCRARGLPDRMLRWHYRSRHESLIAVSNSQFYENKLLIVPSPFTSEAGLGLQFHHFPETTYDRGGTRTNIEEAKIVAKAVIKHAVEQPQLSLGVAAFSSQQQRAIFDQVELLRRQHPETEGFFGGHPEEPFFVKSLENIQGDERDVIFISVGYGRDAHGHMTMNFGPLGKAGGERRLNVLISRAKSRCEVFSSITDEDINLSNTQARGTVAFKLFLHYARTKRLHIDPVEDETLAKRVLEAEVAAALRERGYQVDTDVGIAGLFVDIAVANPKRPGRYVLGIECDGQWYGLASWARDRDRLRDKALRDKGWTMHRIWSADWFHRPRAELDRVVAAIDRALADDEQNDNTLSSARRPVPVDVRTVAGIEYDEVGLVASDLDEPTETPAYEEASFRVPTRQYELHQVPAPVMAQIVSDIVAIEGPVHGAEVVARVRDLWGLKRAGGRIQEAVEGGIVHALQGQRIEQSHKDFLSAPGQVVQVRDRSEVASSTLRRPDYLPPQEIDVAVLGIVNGNLGATVPELVMHVSRQLGYRSTSAQLRAVIEDRIDYLVRNGKAKAEDGLVCPF
jgi:very-short-patch-repair endonuclease